MGCMNKVFRGEIDVELFEQAERTRHGFGGVKMTGLPLPQCRATVERAYDGYMHQLSKIGGMYAELAKEAYKPVEKALANSR